MSDGRQSIEDRTQRILELIGTSLLNGLTRDLRAQTATIDAKFQGANLKGLPEYEAAQQALRAYAVAATKRLHEEYTRKLTSASG